MDKVNIISDNEFILEADGWSFHICLGEHNHGRYIAIPDWGICTEASRWDDVFWNSEQLKNCKDKTIKRYARTIADAVAFFNKEK